MKKLLVLALVLGLCSTACGKKEEAPATDNNTEVAAEVKADEAKADDMANLIKDGKIDKDAIKALYAGKDEKAKTEVDFKLLKSENPLLRAYAFDRTTRNYDADMEELQAFVAALKAEKDPAVLKSGLKSLMNNLKVSKDLYEFAKESAKNENKDIRMGAAMGIVNPNNKSVEGIYDEAVKLLDDEDKEVAGYACQNLTRLENEGAVAEIVKRINSEEAKHVAINGKCAEGLMELWYNDPFFNKYDAAANKATIDYLNKTPRSKDLPAWNVISKFKKAPKDEWKAMAKDFNAKDLVAALSEIVKDENANSLAREYSIDAIAIHGAKADLEALDKAVADDKIKGKIAKAMKSL